MMLGYFLKLVANSSEIALLNFSLASSAFFHQADYEGIPFVKRMKEATLSE